MSPDLRPLVEIVGQLETAWNNGNSVAWTAQFAEDADYGRGIDQHRRRSYTPDERVGCPEANGRQLDLAGAVQHQQQTTTYHVAQSSIGLLPLPCLAQLRR